MSLRVRDAMTGGLGELRHEPTAKRIRAVLDGATVVDTVRAVLLWEPRRIVPTYAIPETDVRADLRPAADPATPAGEAGHLMPELSQRPVLDPSIPFTVHTAEGAPFDVVGGGDVHGWERPGAAFRLADPGLAGYVVLDFAAFDGWLEEDEPAVGHPKDPFHRIDVLRSSRRVRLELHGEVLAESVRPTMLFETSLPTRYYLPRADIRADMAPSPTTSTCAYKGEASYWSFTVGGRTVPDLAWTYEHPLREAAPVQDLVCFFDEHVDVELDGVRLAPPGHAVVAPRSRRSS